MEIVIPLGLVALVAIVMAFIERQEVDEPTVADFTGDAEWDWPSR